MMILGCDNYIEGIHTFYFYFFKLYFIDYATTVLPISPLCPPPPSTPLQAFKNESLSFKGSY